MLSTQRDVLFLVLMSACSLGYRCILEALLSWYKYLLFRNIYTTAGCALLGSRNGLLILLQQQPFLISVECFGPIDAQHFCLGTSIFSSVMLSTHWDVLFSDLVTACSIGYCSNHSHFGGVLWSYRRSALLSWYKYLLFRNAFTTAERCFS